MTWWQYDRVTRWQDDKLETQHLHFKSILNMKLLLTYSLTRVKSRDASASKNMCWWSRRRAIRVHFESFLVTMITVIGENDIECKYLKSSIQVHFEMMSINPSPTGRGDISNKKTNFQQYFYLTPTTEQQSRKFVETYFCSNWTKFCFK